MRDQPFQWSALQALRERGCDSAGGIREGHAGGQHGEDLGGGARVGGISENGNGTGVEGTSETLLVRVRTHATLTNPHEAGGAGVTCPRSHNLNCA